jgi:hypothetical protein
MTVGITMKIYKDLNIFGNGLGQNALMLYDLISKIDFIDKVHLVHFDRSLKIEDLQNLHFLDNHDVVMWGDEESEKIDLLITLGVFPDEGALKRWKENDPNRRVVVYKGGNNMVLLTEDIIFERKWVQKNDGEVTKSAALYSNNVDEVWMVPQQEYHNKDFFELTFKAPARSVPFVWKPDFVELEFAKKKEKVPYIEIEWDKKDFNTWRLVSMEPNQSVLKNMVPILFFLEDAYNQRPEVFKLFNITNGTMFRDNPLLIDVVKELNIQKDGKLGFDPRWTVESLLTTFSEMIVSHQWGNPLNYAYLDVVYYGFPLIHNAHLCKDIGYYYEGYKLKDASKMILKAIDERPNDKDYMQRHREILKRYQAKHNQGMVNQYADLIKALWDGPKVEGEWNWKTNLIE